jgi:tetratricopeptide (TPR) repeat protein
LLEAAVNQWPGNLSLLMTLGNTYPIRQKASANERLRWFQAAVAAAPTNPAALTNVGNALSDKGQFDEAIACHKKAIELAPDHALYHTNLGVDLAFKGDLNGAIDCFEKAIAFDPNHALGHYNLGLALDLKKGPLDKVLACYTRAAELDPTHAEAQCNLGGALARQGRFAESLAAYKRGHELGTERPGWSYPSADWVRRAEEEAAMEARLPAFLKGEFRPGDSKERLGLAGVCYAKKLHHAATGLFAAAFAADPGLADDLQAQHRYNAACNAALAAGQGEDAAKLDDKERMGLRKRALDWLRADLALRTQQMGSDKPADRAAAQQALRHWQRDTDLAGLRDKAALANLPAEERKAFALLWADVAATLQKAAK